jgi:hypothetical protein
MVPPGKVKTVIDFANQSPASLISLIVYGDDYDCSGNGFVAFFKYINSTSFTTYRQRKFQTVTYQYFAANSSTVSSCKGTYTFPTDGATHFRVTTRDIGKECSLNIEREDTLDNNPHWVSVPLTKRQPRIPISQSGAFCEPSAQFRGSSVYVPEAVR